MSLPKPPGEPSSPAIQIGTTGADTLEVPDIKYEELEILSELGKGCFGVVYKGKCRGKIVAIKKLHQQNMDDMEEFKKEIQILTHLRHPNIVLFMGACTEPGKLAIVTEFLPLGDVHAVVHNSGTPLPLLKILTMAKDVAQGMTWLHLSKPPIIHRDLKPTNLLVDENWNVKICDFGLSAWQLSKTLQDPGVAPGTPLWMSPEVLKGKPLSEKADVYSFGIVLWEMLTHKEPFEDHEEYEQFVKAVCDNQERPEIPEGMHQSLSTLLMDCWNGKPNKRPSFEEIIKRIEEAMVDTTVVDAGAARMWKLLWPGQLQTSWNQFSVEFYKLVGEPPCRDRDLNYKCLQKLLIPEEQDFVTLDRFGYFSKWFSPLTKGVLDRLREVMSLPCFHGDISRKECEALLSSFKKGAFLVRLSMTEPIQVSPFTVSKVNGKGEVNHQRIYVCATGHYVHVKDRKNKNTKLEVPGSLGVLIKHKKVVKELNLVTPTPGSKYQELFQKKKAPPNPYINEDDDD